MKLITETVEQLQFITEERGGKKELFIEGVFLQSDVKNKNGRFYPKTILEREVGRYNKEYVTTKRAFGELGHPEGPVINLERVSHMITELGADGKNFVGKAKIMTETPYGKIVASSVLYFKLNAWTIAILACSIAVEASAGKPITSPTA